MVEPLDAELLLRFRTGDSHALTLLLERYETPLYHFLLGMLRDHHQAEDTLQETFIKALQQLDGVDPEHLRGWLFTVAYHQAMLFRRRQKRRASRHAQPKTAFEDHSPDPALQAETRDEVRRLGELLDHLPQVQREVIRQRVYEGKRFRDIAKSMGCPLNTALARMHDGLKRLRILWEREHV